MPKVYEGVMERIERPLDLKIFLLVSQEVYFPPQASASARSRQVRPAMKKPPAAMR